MSGEEKAVRNSLGHGVNHVPQLLLAMSEAAQIRKLAEACLLPVFTNLCFVIAM